MWTNSISLCLLSFFFAASAHASAFVVTNTANTSDGVCNVDCSFRDALQAANTAGTDDSIEFSPAVFSTQQTIAFFGNANIEGNGSLTINGPGANLLTFDGLNFERIWTIRNNANVTINGVTLTKGGLREMGVSLGGGAIRINGGTVVINNSVITANGAVGITLDGEGGGIYNLGSLTLNNTVVSNNRTRVDDSEAGGGIFNGAGATLSVINSTISGNVAGGPGGAVFNLANVTTIIVGSTITGNSSSGDTSSDAGGIYNTDGSLQITDSQFASNSTPPATFARGGAIRHNLGNLVITGSTFAANSSATAGGIFNGGTATITSSTFTGNTATNGPGGGILNVGSLALENVTLNNNSTATITNFEGGKGGGIYNDGTLTITNSTITRNQASNLAGGIYAPSAANLESVTLSSNTAAVAGGGAFGIFNSHNTIIGDNNAAANAPDLAGTLNSQGYNLIENTSGATITGVQTGNILGRDPQLRPLGNYGGATQTVALNASSPAIDAGDPSNFPAVDQRGIARPQDGDLNDTFVPEIGAYERQLEIFAVTKTADTNDGTCDGDCSLREAVTQSNATASPDHAVLFDPTLFSSPQTITLTTGEITIDGDGTLLIAGSGRDLLTVSGNNLSRIFFIETGASLAIRSLTIANGKAPFSNGGAVHISRAALSLTDVVVRNSESGNGGAIKNEGGMLMIANSLLSSNVATTSGGAISSSDSAEFRATLRLEEAVFRNNSAMHGGGALENAAVGVFTVNKSVFENNTVTGSSNSGGALQTRGVITINESLFSGNTATDGGGGIRVDDSTAQLTITSSTFRNNTAAFGGGVRVDGPVVTIANSTFSFNTANGRGAGLLTNGGTVTVTGCTFNDNNALDDGGGIGNFAQLTLTNSTITNNRATDTGGGIYNGNTATVTYTTISNNQANHGGGVVNGGTFTARGMLVGDNTANTTTKDFAGTLNSLGNNLIENAAGATITGTTTGNIIGQDPRLGPLRNNGGQTMTRALLPGSPAIDAGSPGNYPSTDQRGVVRPKDGDRNGTAVADIGSFERDPLRDNKAPFDFDGDGRTDIGIFRPVGAASEWWINRSSNGQTFALQFGASTDLIAPADYTGDGKTDIAFFRPSSGEWYVLRSEDFSFFALPFGTNGDIPVPADYDGDGKADFAVFRPSFSTWFISQSSGAPTRTFQFGITGDQPTVADYDGDGKADIGVFRPAASGAEWWIERSTAGSLAMQFGSSTDKPVQGDYTGDGKPDIAIWRPSTGDWLIVRSEDFSFFGFPFGASGDVPSPGDYDGDGKFDPTVFRPSNATWFLGRTTAGTQIVQFGATGDRPLPNAFVP